MLSYQRLSQSSKVQLPYSQFRSVKAHTLQFKSLKPLSELAWDELDTRVKNNGKESLKKMESIIKLIF